MARALNLLSTRDRKLFSDDMFATYNQTAEAAAEIAKEAVETFLENLRGRSTRGTLDDLNVEIETKNGNVRGYRYLKYIITIDHPVFEWLDEGHPDATPLDAYSYGLKAFPLVAARSKRFGNQPITRINSLRLRIPITEDGTIFRRFIRRPVAPRNFVPKLEKVIEQALAKEGLKIDVKVITR